MFGEVEEPKGSDCAVPVGVFPMGSESRLGGQLRRRAPSDSC